MRLDKNSKVELIATTDETRPHLLHPWLDVEAKVLVATDGTRLIKHPVVIDDGDVSAFVSVVALKAARKLVPKKVAHLEIAVGVDHLTLTNGMTMPTPKSDLSFPPYEKVIPNYSNRETVTVGLDAKLLMGLCQALGGGKGGTAVRLTFPVKENGEVMLDPIVVEYMQSDAIGILMPSRP